MSKIKTIVWNLVLIFKFVKKTTNMKIEDFDSYEAYSEAYSELVQLFQSKKITLLEFIRNEENLYSEYKLYLQDFNMKEGEVSALNFMDYRENIAEI